MLILGKIKVPDKAREFFSNIGVKRAGTGPPPPQRKRSSHKDNDDQPYPDTLWCIEYDSTDLSDDLHHKVVKIRYVGKRIRSAGKKRPSSSHKLMGECYNQEQEPTHTMMGRIVKRRWTGYWYFKFKTTKTGKFSIGIKDLQTLSTANRIRGTLWDTRNRLVHLTLVRIQEFGECSEIVPPPKTPRRSKTQHHS